MKEVGQWIIVASGLIAGLVASFSCMWFSRILWREKELLLCFGFFMLGLLVLGLISGLFLITLEKGL